jgi:MFS family permease
VSSLRRSNIVFFVALLASALVLAPALAHVMELSNKIDLPRDEYFTVQKVYRGWSQIAWVLIMQIAALVAAAILERSDRRVMLLTVLALACVAAAQGLFWTFTYPANAATANWTIMPDDWERLRSRWEYSHAAGAPLQLLGFCLLVGAALSRGRRDPPRSRFVKAGQ